MTKLRTIGLAAALIAFWAAAGSAGLASVITYQHCSLAAGCNLPSAPYADNRFGLAVLEQAERLRDSILEDVYTVAAEAGRSCSQTAMSTNPSN